MKKNLPIVKQNSKVVITKTKNLMGITNKVLNNKLDLGDDAWIQRLWGWADVNHIPVFGWINTMGMGYWGGLPRSKKELMNLTELNLERNKLTKLSKEIGQLTNLTNLNLYRNNLTELPKEIGLLTSLTELILFGNPNLIYTQKQKEWIKYVIQKGGNVSLDNNLWDELSLDSTFEIDI